MMTKIHETSWQMQLMLLMATGEQKYIDVVAKDIREADWAKPDADKIEQLLKGDIDMGDVGWYWGYHLITLSEYYLLTKDASDLKKAIKKTHAFYASFVGRGALPYGVHGPKTHHYNNNGTSGSAALCMSLVGNTEVSMRPSGFQVMPWKTS